MRVYFEMLLRFCRITDRSSLRISRNENGGRLRLILVRDDDEEDVVLLDEVEDLAVRSVFDPLMSDVDCLSLFVGNRPTSVDHERVTCLTPSLLSLPQSTLPSTSSQSVADDVEADRIGGNEVLCFALKNGIILDRVECDSGHSSVGLLLALVSVLLLSDEPIKIFECFLLGLNEKLNMEFCSFAIDNEEVELALTGISKSKSLDFGRFDGSSSN